MHFDLDSEQRDLAAAAADFLGGSASPGVARGLLDDAGAAIAPGRVELVKSGFAAITVPESAGGGGGSVLDLAVVAEQAGRVLAGPSLVTFARAAVLLDGDDTRLAALADGSLAVAIHDGGPVLDAVGADSFLTLAGDDIVIGSGTVTTRDPIDATRGLADVEIGDTEVVAAGAADRWRTARLVGQVVLAAEGLGTAARAVEVGIAYTKERHAFGRPIGSYQAVKHALVDAYVAVEQLRSLVWWGAWAADHAPDELPLAAAAAKGQAAVALEGAAETLIQVHGGIGFTWEHDAHLFWRRAKVDRFLLGDDVAAFDEVARIALAGAGR
ncbi:acyl-CoA dehydrogenase family protein [Nocardioides caeni]|uniref:Acyl-CoA dehydrogenase n=1 Tax=Nocardioides caeni TaxID=574700 RepID=A0A4S8N064_9ACTN|nr:acyl-CoA dehydrogenase family protein [Nocardioides caeni]THV08831.1 acyl-CoA dehydrogenase [Nocardioides caeni]